MVKDVFVFTVRPWDERKRKRKLIAQPNKSMPISEIVRRFSRGLDAGVNAALTSNHPDSELDLERMSRMDRLDKAFTADDMRRDNERIASKAKEELGRLEDEERLKLKKLKAKKAADRKAEPPQGGSAVGA